MLKILKLTVPAGIAVFFAVLAGCGSTPTTPTTTYVDNPNVKVFDSVGVEEAATANTSLTSINFVNGTNMTGLNGDRDCSMADNGSLGKDFYLRSGVLANNLLPAGYETRFFLVKSDATPSQFDTMSAVYDNIGTAFDPTDFTQDNTSFWGYFEYPLLTHPVYCFWLKGKKDAGVISKDYFGIIQPRESTDLTPGAPYDYRMSFRIRINTNGQNDFRKQIPQVQ